MSLVRLLTAGKSLVGIRDDESRYRVTNHRLLPKFGKRNPFHTKPAAAPQGQSPASEVVRGEKPAGETAAKQARPAAPAPQRHSLLPEWIARLADLFVRKPSPLRTAVPRFHKPAVQGELSLETVKVMRNDLSDSDLVVVPAKAAPGAGAPARPAVAQQKLEPAGTSGVTANLI